MRTLDRARTLPALFLATATVVTLQPQTFGQSVFSGGFPGPWGALTTPPPREFFGPEYDGVAGISGSVSAHAAGTGFGGSGFILLGTRGTVTNTLTPPTDPPDAFRWQVAREQTFTLLEPATVAMPAFLVGNITLASAAAANAGLVNARVVIYDAANAGLLSATRADFRIGFTNGIGGFAYNTFDYPTMLLPAGTYRARATLEIGGEGGSISSPEGARATSDFFTGGPDGFGASISGTPVGLTSSRAAVRAVEARSTFAVDGTGVEVGLVETGNPYLTHASLAGKVTVTAGGLAGDFRREHSLATAGIIAASDASADNAGVAPGSTIRSAPISSHAGGFNDAVGSLLAATPGMRVMSMSAGLGSMTTASVPFINGTINGKPNLTFVKSAGNDGVAGGITDPGLAENIITVGAVNRNFTRRVGFSSWGAAGATPMKPDIVAPGEYINAPQALDTNADTLVNDFGRGFLGDDYRYTIAQSGGGVNSGAITGTSFAAPHVSGAAALLHEYQIDHPAAHEQDHRVIKAILLNGATKNVLRGDGSAWRQANTGSLPGLTVTRSLDEELGAGLLDVLQSLKNYEPDEVRPADGNTMGNLNIPTAGNNGFFWDLERAASLSGRVNYLLGDIVGAPLRATLTWDFDQTGGTGLQPLELRLYEEGAAPANPVGFDPADLLIASTFLAGENVKLLDLSVGDFNGSRQFYLQVINGGVVNTDYGLAVAVPEPGVMSIVGMCVLIARRTRRR